MSDAKKIHNVLFLCTGNSARSIIAECILKREGIDRFGSFSAGSHPKGEVHPDAIETLQANGFSVDDLRSKSWDEFAADGAPALDFVFTVCDNAAGEICPIWPGQPVTAHWGIPDPAAVDGSAAERRSAFEKTLRQMSKRIEILVNLPIESFDQLTLQKSLDEIGTLSDENV